MVLPESSKPRPSRLHHETQLHGYGAMSFAGCNQQSRVMHKATAIVHPAKIPDVIDDAKRNASRLFLLLGLGALDLRRAAEGLLPVLALLACIGEGGSATAIPKSQQNSPPRLIRKSSVYHRMGRVGETYAAACSPSRSWWPGRRGPGGSGARTSSSPRESRRPERSRWSCRHRTGSGDQRRKPGPSGPCTCRRACRGAHPWRCWRGSGGGCHCGREKRPVSTWFFLLIGQKLDNPRVHPSIASDLLRFIRARVATTMYRHWIALLIDGEDGRGRRVGAGQRREEQLTRPSACGRAEGCG